MNKISTTLLISTYNWPEALALVLRSVLKQTVMPDEVIIADDGSDERTRQVIDGFRKEFKTELKHIWHEDKGFRKSKILNRAVASAASEYIIQVDGDCFLHPNFIEDHIENADRDRYLYGTRVRIKETAVPGILSRQDMNIHFFKPGLKKRPRNIRIPVISGLFKTQPEISPKFRGCNTSYWREDFIAINGYNEDLEGWGREDSELMIRMHNLGQKAKRLKFNAIVYHLDHHENERDRFEINDRIQETTIKEALVSCDNGVGKYL
ncbi:glycosyltransferase family 2 protein [Robertkochia sediminum]|uniref:glycosyltransferase family 2 protein n=1 Tax=Robertkochia sediminum TaxID=2785326 RepID=UPI001F1D9C08|nr:glycosyltransferase family 2 protein [Robertkochia sediminum]